MILPDTLRSSGNTQPAWAGDNQMRGILKCISTVLMFCCFSVANASHIVGGDLHYEYLGNNLYQITLKVYRDCATSSTDFDDPAAIGIYDAAGNLVENIEVLLADAIVTDLPIEVSSICISPPEGLCVKEAIFSATVELPPIAGGYTLAYQRCCRNVTIVNTESNDDLGITLTTTIPGPEIAWPNSNPAFVQYPPIVICLNQPFVFDHSATDSDGDELVYQFCTPLLANMPGFYINPPGAPPYPELIFNPGYTYDYPLDSDPAFEIDPVTGLLTGTPTLLGQFVVGICVSEYRNGELINVTNRDFQFNITMCEPNAFAAIATQSDYCDGLTVDFGNLSGDGFTYAWNFGVEDIDTDTSSLYEPTYIFPDTGYYNITLILNPGLACADTATMIYHAAPEALPVISNYDFDCDDGVLYYSFNGEGGFSGTETYLWHFGDGANPLTSTEENPSGIVLNGPGLVEVTLTVFDSGCDEELIIEIDVPAAPHAIIAPQETFCDGFYYIFENLSENATDFYWDFGAAGFEDASTFENPEYMFPDTGLYLVMLVADSPGMCSDTAWMWMNIYGLLQPLFVAPDPQCFEGNSFSFSALGASTDNATYLWAFGNNATPETSTAQNPSGISFDEPGAYDVYLTIMENGCEETFADQVEVVPNPVMNAFIEPVSGCPDLYVNFQCNSTGSTQLFYLWDFGDGYTSEQANPTHAYTTPGTYDVTLTVYTLTGCIESLTQTFEDVVTVLTPPVAVFIVDPNPVNIMNPTINVTDISVGSIGCVYYISDGGMSTDCNFTYTFEDGGIFTIEQYVINEAGCSDYAIGTVYVEGYIFYAPNSFTPNGDGMNEAWKPIVFGASHYLLQIFNRWGDKIFETTNPDEPWLGEVHGGDYFAQDGVYNYRVVINDLLGYPHDYAGHVVLVR